MARPRLRYLDLLRVLAIGAVVIGHWLLVDVTYRGGHLSGLDALEHISWGGWVTLVFQVMPVFFLVGGYVNAASWTTHHERGVGWTPWVRARALRLLWPTTVYVAAVFLAVATAMVCGVSSTELAQAGWLVALHLWFLPVYLLLIALTPVMLAAHRRWGLIVPAVMALAAGAVDVGVLGSRLPFIGFANYLLVWGSMHQWGFAWRDGLLTRTRWRPYALAGAGVAVFAALVSWGPFPVDMIGTAEHTSNTSPPSVALLAFAATQAGLVLAAEPAGSRLLDRSRWGRRVERLNPAVITVYLWHMVPVIVVAVVVYTTSTVPQPDIGSWQWWALRLPWLGVLAAAMVPLTRVIIWLERPLARLHADESDGSWWAPVVLTAGLAATGLGLARLAIGGFAYGGRLALLGLAAYVCGLALIEVAGQRTRLAARAKPIARGRRASS
jgi:fucose 4-O-acetylase-like acetyltransferase